MKFEARILKAGDEVWSYLHIDNYEYAIVKYVLTQEIEDGWWMKRKKHNYMCFRRHDAFALNLLFAYPILIRMLEGFRVNNFKSGDAKAVQEIDAQLEKWIAFAEGA